MTILSVGNFGTGWDGSVCDEEHIAKALESLGHEVVRQQREETFWNDTKQYDFVLIAQWDGYNTFRIQRLQKHFNCPIVYWAFDHQDQNQEWHQQLIANSDLYLSKRMADSKYNNWQWFSQDFAPEFLYEPQAEMVKDIDVLFTGSYLPWATERNETLKAVDDKFNLQIYSVTPGEFIGRGFKNVHGPVVDEGLMQLIPRAKVNLSIDHTIEAGYWSDRNAQIICCGGFVLTRYVPLMESRFHHNVMYFHNIEQCLNDVEFWLEHDEDREVVAAEGYENSPYYKVKDKVADLIEVVERIL
jgi:hypothetical protein